MTLQEIITKVDHLKKELNSLNPLQSTDKERLWKKVRLDWNYNSNHIEGNTLTYGETELLLIFEKTTGDHDKREYDEMQAHDVALHVVRDMADENEHPLTESFIKELNKTILVRPYWKEAITPDGQPTRKQIIVGDYKNTPNSVRLQSGEIFHYATPDDVRPMMEELMNFYNKHEADTESHPLWLAAMFHYKFVRIHPFDDGNGRIARLIMNYILMKKKYPPVIVLAADKKNYLLALNKADTGDLESFVIYIGKQLIRSLEMSIKAAKGDNIEEPEDMDKEIELLRKKLRNKKEAKVKKSREVLKEIYTNTLHPLLTVIETKLLKFDDFFNEKEFSYNVNQAAETTILKSPGRDLSYIENQIFLDIDNPTKYGYIGGVSYTAERPQQAIYPEISQIRANYFFKGFRNNDINPFDIGITVQIEFTDYTYTINCNYSTPMPITKLYNESFSETEQNDFANEMAKKVLSIIKNNTGIK